LSSDFHNLSLVIAHPKDQEFLEDFNHPKQIQRTLGGNMKTTFFATILGIILISGYSHAQRGPRLTDTQRTCLEEKIGKPGSGSRPSPDQMKFAFESCGIEAPQRGPGPNLTDEQRTCLEGKIGKPSSGNRPSREQLDAAFSTCGIARPDFGATGDLPALKVKYAAATADEEKDAIRESIRQIFYTTNDESLKAQIRKFLHDNPQAVTWSDPAVESRASAARLR